MTQPADDGQLSLDLADHVATRLPTETARSSTDRDAFRLDRHTGIDTVSVMLDKAMIGRLVRVASQAQHEHDPIRRVELLSEVAQLVQGSLELAVAEAKTAGYTWRALGSRLSVPYQTLYRRYGRATA
jgi:hypothetical protein